MSGSTENRAPDASESPKRREVVLNLGVARRMLPLVAQIVADVLNCQRSLAALVPEQERLERQRHGLPWPQRQRRYQLGEEVNRLEQQLYAARQELDQLGVALIDASQGRVGLPTVVNNHLAFFSWMPGDDGLRHWHFAGEMIRRTIPASWKECGDIRLVGKS